MSSVKRNPVRLLALAAVCAVVIVYFVVLPGHHDPLWWKHAGLDEHKQGSSNNFMKWNSLKGQHGMHLTDNSLSKGHAENAESVRGMEALGMSSAKKNVIPGGKKAKDLLEQGVTHISDYDVSKVNIPREEPLLPGEKKWFSYVDQNTSKYDFVWLSNSPRVLFVPEFLTDEECDAIKKRAEKTLVRSQVATYGNDKNPVNDVRTSSQTWLGMSEPTVRPVIERILDFMGFPSNSAEMMQILRYEIGQKYDAHNDYFDPQLYGKQSSNRAATVFLYLNTVEEGGETQFPNADGKPPTSDFKSCRRGLRVRPTKRSLAIFYDMSPTGKLDPMSLHGGCPVKKGVKWGGTLWLRINTGGHH